MSKTLNKIKKTNNRVVDVEDLGPDEESRYWIHLRAGWFSPLDGSHTITGRTVREATEALKAAVPCRCSECSAEAEDRKRKMIWIKFRMRSKLAVKAIAKRTGYEVTGGGQTSLSSHVYYLEPSSPEADAEALQRLAIEAGAFGGSWMTPTWLRANGRWQ